MTSTGRTLLRGCALCLFCFWVMILFSFEKAVAARAPGRKLIDVAPGVKWLEGTVTFDFVEGGSFIPAVMELGGGTLVVQFDAVDHRWIRGRPVSSTTPLITFSRDRGKTWARPIKVPYSGESGWWGSFGAGDTFYAFSRDTQTEGKSLRKGIYMLSGRVVGGEVVWNPEVLVHPEPPDLFDGGFGGTCTDKGTFFCLYTTRTQSGGQQLWLRRSTDRGQTWSEPALVDSEGGGYKEILSLPGGRLVAIWAGGIRPGQEFSKRREGVHLRISEDEGQTWSGRHTVEPFMPPFYKEDSTSWTSIMTLRFGPGPKLVQATTTPDGAIVALGRWSSYGTDSSPPVARVIAATSYDAGFTWTEHTVLHEITGDVANRINLLGAKRGIRTSSESGHHHTYGSSCTVADGVLIVYTAPDYDADRKRVHLVKLPAYPGQSSQLSGARWSNRELGLFPYELRRKFNPLPEGTTWTPIGPGAVDGSLETHYLLAAEYMLPVTMRHPRVRCHILRHRGQSVAAIWSDEGQGILRLHDAAGLSVRDVDDQVMTLAEGQLRLGLRPTFLFTSLGPKEFTRVLSQSTLSDLPPPESKDEMEARQGMLIQFHLGTQRLFFEDGGMPRRESALDHFESSPPKAAGEALILDGSQAVKLKTPEGNFRTSPMIYVQPFTASLWVKPEGGSGERAAVSQQFQFEIGLGQDGRPYGWLNLISDAEYQREIWNRLDWGPQHQAVQAQISRRLLEGAVHVMGKPYRVQGETPLREGEWAHLALHYDGRELQLYVNGKLTGSRKAEDRMIPRLLRQGQVPDLWVGRSAAAQGNYWRGGVADLRLYGKALDLQRLLQLLAASRP